MKSADLWMGDKRVDAMEPEALRPGNRQTDAIILRRCTEHRTNERTKKRGA